MKKILLLLSCLILSITSFSQSTHPYSLDTLFLKNGNYYTGKVDSFVIKFDNFNDVKDGNFFMSIPNVNTKYKIPSNLVNKISISDSNSTKKSILSSYNNFLKENMPKYIMSKNQMAGFYLKRGANRQIGGIVTTVISNLAGLGIVAITSNYNSSPAGYIIMGGGTLVGSIMYISGISDYRKSGEILKN